MCESDIQEEQIKSFFLGENARTVVDLGCGLGNYTEQLNDMRWV